MNYRHAFHAGNFADVLKHAVLARIIVHLNAKEAAYRVLDSHAGVGLYDLAADEAARTGEWVGGIGRIEAAALSPALEAFLEPYLDVIGRLVDTGGERPYPGSPLIAAELSRPQDRLVFNEKHPEDAARLSQLFGTDRRVKVTDGDGFIAVRSALPFHERRGLTVIDPPFEQPGEFDRLAQAMDDALRRFQTGTMMVWYPLKDRAAIERFHDHVAATDWPKVLRVEQWIRRPGSAGPLAGAGLIVANPPWRLHDDLAGILPELTALLADGPDAGFRLDWLVAERN